MKVAVVCMLAFACACASEDVRPKRSLFAYPTFYSAYYGAPVVAPLSPVIASASKVVGQPGFIPRTYISPYNYNPYNPYGYWPSTAAVYFR